MRNVDRRSLRADGFRWFAASVLVWLLGSQTVFAGPNVWTPFGPEGGNASQILTHPNNVNLLYAVAGGRIFRSNNAGASWATAMRGLPDTRNFIQLSLVPNDPNKLYALVTAEASARSQGVYRSTDGGSSWRRLRFAFPSNVFLIGVSADASTTPGTDKLAVSAFPGGLTGLFLSDDGGRTFRNPAAGSGYPVEIGTFTFASVRHGNSVFAVTSGPNILRSLNDGASFSTMSGFPGGVTALNRLRAAPSATGSSVTLYGSGNGIPAICSPCIDGIRVTNATSTLITPTITALPDLHALPWIKPGTPAQLLHPDPETISSSNTSGSSFTTLLTSIGGGFQDVAGQFDYPTAPATFYFASATRGLLKSSNNGVSSAAINTGLRGWSSGGLALVQTSATTLRLLTGMNSEVNGNNLAARVINTSGSPGAWATLPVASTGVTGIPAVVVDFVDTQRIYAGNTSTGALLRSTNGGASFSAISLPGLRNVNAIALDPRSCASPPPSGPCTSGALQRVYVGGNENSSVSPGSNSGALQVSNNGGTSFSTVTGFTRPAASNVSLNVTAISAHPSQSQVVYAGSELIGTPPAAQVNGIFRSTNGGTTFAQSASGIPNFPSTSTKFHVLSVRAAPSNGNIVYAGVTDSRTGPSSSTGMYKSTDMGANWTSVGLERRVIRDIWISPSNPDRVYAAFSGSKAGPGGVARTLDGGQNWTVISRGLPLFGASSIEAFGNTLFVSTPFGVYTFTDGVDDDLDNVDSTTESAAPNGGDLNFDGTPDRVQKSSASFVLKTDGEEAPEAERGVINYGNEDDVTPAVAPDRVAGSGAGCGQLNNAYGIDADTLETDFVPGQEPLQFDHSLVGLVNVELNECSFAVIDVYFHNGQFTNPADWRWRNYGPVTPGDDENIDWYTFAGAQRINDKKWRLTIEAGEPGVYRADPNSILLRGGPAFLPDQLFRNGFQ